jgi:hypothetical protein
MAPKKIAVVVVVVAIERLDLLKFEIAIVVVGVPGTYQSIDRNFVWRKK